MMLAMSQTQPKPLTPTERMIHTAYSAGCSAEQVRRLLGGGYVPQPKQWNFHAAARACDNPSGPTIIGMGGARGGAKSHAAVCQVVHDDCMRVPGLKYLYLRNIGASARESFSDMLQKSMPMLLLYYVSNRGALELPNGSRVILGGFRNENDVDKYIGIEYDGLLIDDCHLISKSKFDKIRGSVRTSRDNWRPRTYLTFNPGGVGHAYLKRILVEPWRNKRETDTRFFFSLPEDNKFLNPEYIAYLDKLSGWLYRAWRQGDFDIAAGQFFENWDRDRHVIPHFAPPHDWRVWLAMDYGHAHFNVVYLLAESNAGIIYAIDEHAERGWLVKQHVQAVREMLNRNGIPANKLETFVAGGDAFMKDKDGDTVADRWAAEGFELAAANSARINGAAELLDRLGTGRLKITEHCPRLIECLPSLMHDPNRPEDVLKVDVDDDGNGGDDFYDALRYGVMFASAQREQNFVI
jgi:phage terminase large subunit